MPTASSKIQITTAFMVSMLAVSLLATTLLAAFWVGSEYRHFSNVTQEMEAQYNQSRKGLLRAEVARVIDYLAYEKAQAEGRLMADIKSRVDEAYALADSTYRRYRDRMPVDALKRMVMENLRSIRFNDGRGYFFATDLDGVELLFADHPELEGQNLLDMQDSEGRYVIRDMIALVKEKTEGYYRYNWTMPHTAGQSHPKIAYVKHFEPFNCFIGTGEYLEAVENDIKAEVIGRIEEIRFGRDGYIFVGTYDGVSLTKPAKGRNMWDVQDENGVKIVQELIAQARSGGGFVNYVMPKFEGLPSAPKLSYADRFEAWQWYVGAGIYIDEINAAIEEKRAELKRHIRQQLGVITGTSIGVIILTLLAVSLITRRVGQTMQSFTRFFEKTSSEAAQIDTAQVHFMEFERLADAANHMVNERRQTDQALKESLAWNQTIFDAIQSGIVVIDARAHAIVDVNPAAADMIGLPRENIIGRVCHDFICPSEKGQCPILDLNQSVDHEERLLVRPDGTEIPILKTVSRIEVGNRLYLIEGFLDLSKQKKLEGELKQAQKMEAIGTLTGGIAHDFNNILGIILGNTELAQSLLTENAAAHANLEVTKEATLRAKKIVHQLLSYSRQTTADKTAVNINRLTDETLSFLRALIPSSIEIQSHITQEPLVVHGNATQIHQILINLCVNASHAVDNETGLIQLHVAKTAVEVGDFDQFPAVGGAGYVEFLVQDNGHGIAPGIRHRIFDPYFTTKEAGKGTGMGLAVVLGIIRDHDGAITIASQPGRGTTVRVVLPLAQSDPEVLPHADIQKYLGGHQERILFIDDEALLVNLGKSILQRINYTVEGYTNAAEAMHRFQAAPEAFQLIISDMTMPGLNGLRVIETARRIRPDIPIIICSGYSDNMDERRAAELGCLFIQKPIEMQTLSTTVRKALDAKRPSGG
jgi:two-component system cell cycle sensor histidine kinase/response regulator CckA